MSLRYTGAWLQDGAFNPLVAPPPPSTTYYLYSWGDGGQGASGLGNTTNYSSPKQVGSSTNWSTVSAGWYRGFSIKTDGTLWGWGENATGALGLGNTTAYSSPKQVGALTNWLIVSSGYFHTVAIKTDGTMWSWGSNVTFGGLGLGNTTSYSSPKQIGALTTWATVSSGYQFSLAIKTDGTIWSWGYNANGGLGLGNTTSYSSPKQIGALTNWLKVNCLAAATIAIKTDGTIWSWGQNNNGQSGLGNSTVYSSPKQIGALTNWLKLSSGGYYQCAAIKTDGTLWSWGQNSFGQLGLGDTTNRSSPVQVGALTNWDSVTSGSANFTAAIKTDGTLWTWGRGLNGYLGLGNTTDYSSPKQVGSLTTWDQVAATVGNTIALQI